VLFLSLGVTSNESNHLFLLLCCVADGFILGALEFPSVFLCVLQLPLVLLLSLGAASNELNPPPLFFLCCVVHDSLPSGFELFGALLCVFQLPLVSWPRILLGYFWQCHCLGYVGILLAISLPRIFWDTFGNIIA
jgi:hypothetical protein